MYAHSKVIISGSIRGSAQGLQHEGGGVKLSILIIESPPSPDHNQVSLINIASLLYLYCSLATLPLLMLSQGTETTGNVYVITVSAKRGRQRYHTEC